jgi:hypothetical protein
MAWARYARMPFPQFPELPDDDPLMAWRMLSGLHASRTRLFATYIAYFGPNLKNDTASLPKKA